MNAALATVLGLLDVEEIEVNLFRGVTPESKWHRVFGGQVLGQALASAYRTVDGRVCHSLHSYFMRPGNPGHPILYEVDRIRDGRSFTTRRVRAVQHGKAIFSMEASFHIEEAGISHQLEMPTVPAPDELPSAAELNAQLLGKAPKEFAFFYNQPVSIEARPIDPCDPFDPKVQSPEYRIWIKPSGKLPDVTSIHQCLLAYASDLNLLDTCSRPHGFSWTEPKAQIATLDHSMWFHRSFRMDDWLLFDQDTPAAAGARGLSRGSVFTRSGELVASMAQEGLIRRGTPQPGS